MYIVSFSLYKSVVCIIFSPRQQHYILLQQQPRTMLHQAAARSYQHNTTLLNFFKTRQQLYSHLSRDQFVISAYCTHGPRSFQQACRDWLFAHRAQPFCQSPGTEHQHRLYCAVGNCKQRDLNTQLAQIHKADRGHDRGAWRRFSRKIPGTETDGDSNNRVGNSMSSLTGATVNNSSLISGQKHPDGFHMQVANGTVVMVPWIWLRDHCRCSQCYSSTTFQKQVDSYSLSKGVQDFGIEGDRLLITWDDSHISEFSLQWLQGNFYTPGTQAECVLWDKMRMRDMSLPTTSFDLHMHTDDGLRNTLKNIVKYGFCLVQGVPLSQKGTELVAKRICFIQETIYGNMTLLESGVYSHADTAYSSQALEAHTDTTYLTVPAGVQVFHCLHHEGEGGETLLVDGFHCADRLCHNNPSAFDTLATTVIPHESKDGTTYHLYSLGTVLSTHFMTGNLIQIRFNPYDRAPLCTVPPANMRQFYSSYAALTNIIHDSSNELWMKLTPGNVLLVNNWRVLHGRSGFTGKRIVSGCYLPRDEWTSKARVMGVF